LPLTFLWNKLIEEVQELHQALFEIGNVENVKDEAVDVANIAMMIYDAVIQKNKTKKGGKHHESNNQ